MLFTELNKLIYNTENIWNNFTPNNSHVDYQGWNGIHSSFGYLNTSFKNQIIVDLGVWKGQSTITLASILKQNNIDGVVLAVDTFLGSPEHQDMGLYKREPGGRPTIYETFLNNIWSKDLQNYVIPIPQTTIGALHILKRKNIIPTFVHVDAAHEYEEAKRDIDEYYEILTPEGIMVCDDYVQGWPGVLKAVDELIEQKKVQYLNSFPKCIIKKPK